MKLTGKCKQDFEKWYLQWIFKEKTYLSLNFCEDQITNNWKSLHLSEQWGVYVDFFDSKSVFITSKSYGFTISIPGEFHYSEEAKEAIGRCRAEAIEKANQIYNSNHYE